MGRVPGGRGPLQDVEEAPMREFAKEMLVMVVASIGLSIGLSVAIAEGQARGAGARLQAQ